jgi:integrase
LNAIVFLYRHVLECDLGDFAAFVRAKTPRRLPVVLAMPEVRALLSAMEGAALCMALLGYGTGLRVSEVMGLRIKDLDFHTRRIIVRQGKGGKDRVTPLPQKAFTLLKDQIRESRMLYDLDRKNGVPGVALPGALEKKYPRAGMEWGWHFVFAARGISILVIEHVMRAIKAICDRLFVLHHGEKIAEGTPSVVFRDEEVIRAYLGKRFRQLTL